MAILRLHDGTVDLGQLLVLRGGEEHSLSTQDAALLARLVRADGQAVPRSALLTEVLGYRSQSTTRAVDHAIRRLRLKIEVDPSDPRHIQGVRGVGYRFVPAPAGGAPGLVGRDDALAALLSAPGPLVTLAGPGGVGKTALAEAAVAAAPAARLVALAPARSEDEVLQRVATALGLPTASTQLREDIAEALASGPRLLVLDNAEHLLDTVAGLVAAWRPRLPDGAVLLVTSRTRLGIQGEHVIDLPPLDEHAAATLFRGLLPSGASLAPEAAAALLPVLDGLPLAIEIAAAWMDMISPEALRQRLSRSLGAIHSRRRDRPERHASLEAAMDASWALLSDDERHALGRCALFRGSFDLGAAEALLGDRALSALGRLRDKSLLAVLPSRRYRLLETVRVYARQQAGPDAEAALAHARHYCHHLTENRTDPDWVRQERSQVLAAIERCLTLDPALAARLQGALHAYDWSHTPASVAQARIRQIRSALRPEHKTELARMAWGEAQWHSRTGDLEACELLLEDAQALAEDAGEDGLVMGILNQRILYGNFRRDDRLVTELLPPALARARRQKLRNIEIRLLCSAAWMQARCDKVGEARLLLRQALVLAREEASDALTADVLRLLSQSEGMHGALDAAAAHYEEALALDPSGTFGHILTRLSSSGLRVLRGDLAGARENLEIVAAQIASLDPNSEGTRQEALGMLCWAEGDLEAADAHFSAAADYNRAEPEYNRAQLAATHAALLAALHGTHAGAARWAALEEQGLLDALPPEERALWRAHVDPAAPVPSFPPDGSPGPAIRDRLGLHLLGTR